MDNQFLCAEMAKSLNEAGVPCALWGHYAQIVCGSYTNDTREVSSTFEKGFTHTDKLKDMTFVVPDDMVDKAIQALLDAGTQVSFTLESCTNGEKCGLMKEGLPPTHHLHSKTTDVVSSSPDVYLVEIFAQNTVLWTLPPMDATTLLPPRSLTEAEFAKTVPREYLLASDSTTLPGFHKAGQYPVLVPRADILLESCYRILARVIHGGGEWDLATSLYSDIARLVRYVHRFGHLNPALLSPSARDLFYKFKDTSIRRDDWEKALLETF